ncbi:MAG: methyltransferase domain-containing protein [Oscillospiraceae bacterium]|nr:methyltransferase domain-containing protein [Oscillospiraceae bacterium]
MNTYWSTYVQESRELYESRALKFHNGNKDLWLKALQIENGMNVLDVGCGGGIFSHRIKTYLPDVTITGMDRDSAHIEFARAKTIELGLDCAFVTGDAIDLPFADGTFDLCYSQSVMNFCEPHQFVKEQYRVLKPNGRIVILCGTKSQNTPESWIPTDECEEKELFDKVWREAEKNELSNIKNYESNVNNYYAYLDEHGFKNISADAFAFVIKGSDYVNADRLHELSSVGKAYRLAPDALTPEEFDSLVEMINRRYDNKNNLKRWDYRVNTVLAISGEKSPMSNPNFVGAGDIPPLAREGKNEY